MQLLQLVHPQGATAANGVLVIERREAAHVVGLLFSLGNPRCLAEQHVFQLPVLLQAALQVLVLVNIPQLHRLFDGRRERHELTSHGVYIIGCGEGHGIFTSVVCDRRQRLHHEPRRVVRIFYCQLLAIGVLCTKQGSEVNGLHALTLLGERHGCRHKLTCCKHGQISLLAIAEAPGLCCDTADEQAVVVDGAHVEREGKRNCCVGIRVYQLQAGRSVKVAL